MSLAETLKRLLYGLAKLTLCLLTLIVLSRCISIVIPSQASIAGSAVAFVESIEQHGPTPQATRNGTRAELVFEHEQLQVPSRDAVNWCNEPHIMPSTYDVAPTEYELVYVELIQRHHRRTPYAANMFPVETYKWDCDDASLFHFGRPDTPSSNRSTSTYWSSFKSDANPFTGAGFAGTCRFPQLTRGGLNDAWQHGKHLYEVYRNAVKLIADDNPRDILSFRVTNNRITSEVASMTLNGMLGLGGPYPLLIQTKSVDSLEPAYSCPAADALFRSYGVGSDNSAWKAHLDDSQQLFEALDVISGVSPAATDWHMSWDHYFDNLSSRLCHGKALPCSASNPGECISLEQAKEVFQLGDFEYKYLYREAPQSLAMSVASFGVWIAELAQNLREASSGHGSKIVYRHNIAHDGSIARLLSILQVENMGWPGMGAEVAFELYRRDTTEHFVRILWRGRVLPSSLPLLKGVEFVRLFDLLAYFDNLVGEKARLVPGKCTL